MDHLIHIIYLPHASLIYISVIFGSQIVNNIGKTIQLS